MSRARPKPGEFNPYYARYIEQVPDGEILEILHDQIGQTVAAVAHIPDASAGFRYAPEKWSVKEVIGHLADAERIFAYRALCIARGDTTPLPGFDENEYVRQAGFDAVPLAELAGALTAARHNSLAIFEELDAGAWSRSGTANDSPVSVRALAWIMAGHEIHHRTVLKERYLPHIT